MNVMVLTEVESIRAQLPRCIDLAERIGATLPFSTLVPSIQWWRHFNNVDGSFFWTKRGTNFFGAQSILEQLVLFLVEEDGKLCGFAPFAVFRVRAGKDQLRFLCYAGDPVLIPYQGFTVDESVAESAVAHLLARLVTLFNEEKFDLLFLGYQPELSKNTVLMREYFAKNLQGKIAAQEVIVSIRGGVRPWTIRQLSRRMKKLSDIAGNEGIELNGMEEFCCTLAECTPLKLMFPGTRKVLEAKLQKVLTACRAYEQLRDLLEPVEQLLQDRPVSYPYISLPRDHESFMAGLSRSTRYYYRRYMKSFLKAGGSFETVNGSKITDGDVSEYLHLHQIRWGSESMFISKKSYDFHVDLVLEMAARDQFTLFFAKFNGERVAVLSTFDINGRRECYFTGMNPDYQRTRAGRLLWLHSIYDAIDNSFTLYDLGPGDFGYKLSFATGETGARGFLVTQQGASLDLESIFTGYECMVSV